MGKEIKRNVARRIGPPHSNNYPSATDERVEDGFHIVEELIIEKGVLGPIHFNFNPGPPFT